MLSIPFLPLLASLASECRLEFDDRKLLWFVSFFVTVVLHSFYESPLNSSLVQGYGIYWQKRIFHRPAKFSSSILTTWMTHSKTEKCFFQNLFKILKKLSKEEKILFVKFFMTIKTGRKYVHTIQPSPFQHWNIKLDDNEALNQTLII